MIERRENFKKFFIYFLTGGLLHYNIVMEQICYLSNQPLFFSLILSATLNGKQYRKHLSDEETEVQGKMKPRFCDRCVWLQSLSVTTYVTLGIIDISGHLNR